MTSHARAILWAQWRSLLNYYPKSNKAGLAFGGILAALWYGGWSVFAGLICWVFADRGNAQLAGTVLGPGLLFVFLYWQAVPVLLVSTGVSLSTKKLQVYPVPHSQLFLIEILLRMSTSFEMILILSGLATGLLLNSRLPKWSVAAIALFAVFNLCLAAGIRESMIRLFARKRLREVAVLLLVMTGALPQLLIATGSERKLAAVFRHSSLPVWPWSAVAAILTGKNSLVAFLAVAGWTVAAYVFGRWQFERTLRFDAGEGNATRMAGESRDTGLFDRLFRWPSLLFRDPLSVLIEKEMRVLSRAPRFRLIFAMGFTFGLVMWLPMSLGRGRIGGLALNYLTFTCLYALLLLGDVCFWNMFGFDRLAAQAYWAMPVRFTAVLVAKNISATVFVALEILIITAVCAVLRMPMSTTSVLETYAITMVVTLFLISMGNLTSTSHARAIDPAKAMRSGSPGRLQALMVVLYPIGAAPVLLAYAARYAFDSEAAFFGALAVSALVGAAVYWVSLDSAVAAAEKNKERLLAALGRGDGIMQG